MIRFFLSLRYKYAILAYAFILSVFLVIAVVAIMFKHLKLELEKDRNHAMSELHLMTTVAREALLKNDYIMVESFLKQWGEEHRSVIEIEAMAPNGFVLAGYKRSEPANHQFGVEKVIIAGERELATIRMVKDFSPTRKSMEKLNFQLVISAIFLAILLGTVLWFTLRRMTLTPLEKEISERKGVEGELRKASEELEDRVEKRTSELLQANLLLKIEITKRQQAEGKLIEDQDQLEKMVDKRTDELKRIISSMAGREVRMSELKSVIRSLRAQLEEAGLASVIDDPLWGDELTEEGQSIGKAGNS